VESKEFTLSEVIMFIQDRLLSTGIFMDGEAISEVLLLQQDFFDQRGMVQCFMEVEGETE
jgi:hypothetical protein